MEAIASIIIMAVVVLAVLFWTFRVAQESFKALRRSQEALISRTPEDLMGFRAQDQYKDQAANPYNGATDYDAIRNNPDFQRMVDQEMRDAQARMDQGMSSFPFPPAGPPDTGINP